MGSSVIQSLAYRWSIVRGIPSSTPVEDMALSPLDGQFGSHWKSDPRSLVSVYQCKIKFFQDAEIGLIKEREKMERLCCAVSVGSTMRSRYPRSSGSLTIERSAWSHFPEEQRMLPEQFRSAFLVLRAWLGETVITSGSPRNVS
jgi:hypothetical protein